MQLILLRHGDAEFSSPDSERCISAIGLQKVIKMANSYGHKLPPIDLVLTSPLKRALQTTELFIANAALKNSFQVVDFLLPDTNIKTVERQLQIFDNKKILMVGHLPLLDYWIDYLIGNSSFRMATASLASLTMDCTYKVKATLNWVHHVD